MSTRKMSISCVALAAGLLGFGASAMAQEAVRIGTSSVGSNFYTSAVGISEVIQKNAKINTAVEAVGGSAANVRGLAAGRIEFALANSFAAFAGYNANYGFKEKTPVRLVVQGHTNERVFFVRKGAGIKSPADLEGRTVVGKRRALPELELITDVFTKVHGLKNVNVVATTTTSEVFKAFAAGSIDAAIIPTGPRAGNVQKAINDGHIDFLQWDPAKRDEMLKDLPELMFARDYNTKDYASVKPPVPTLSMRTYFITRPGVSDDIVYRVAKAMFEHTDELATYRKELAQWTMENTLKNVALPFHPGVIKYFKEKGVWTDALEAKQKKLLGS